MSIDTPPRVVTVWCPEWPAVAAGVPADRPAAVLRANRVVARTPAAIAAGVGAGDRRRAAQRVCPGLEVLDHEPDRDAMAFEPVIRAVVDMAPRLEVVEPGWLCLAARGPSRYFGGDQALADRLVAVVSDVIDGPVGVGVADGRSASAIAARLAARSEGSIVVAPGGSASFVASLSVAWLRELGDASPDMVGLFVRLGLRTFGHLAALEAADVLGRFGVEGARAHRIAQGGDLRATAATDPSPEWCVEQPFDEPVEQLEAVVFVTKRLADELAARLAGEGRMCTRLIVLVETEHGERSERAWYRDGGLSAMAMVERVRWQLEGWADQPPDGLTGGVALVRLVPDEVRRDDGAQFGMWGGRTQADHDAGRAVVRLTGLAGEQSVRVPAWQGGRLPAERYRWVSAAMSDLEDPDERLDRCGGPWPGASPAPSPANVPMQPTPVEVTDQRGEPVRVSGRGEISGDPAILVTKAGRVPIVAWAGPWPVEQRWWSPDRQRRLARFQIVTERGDAHMVVIERQQWAILATYS